MNYRHAFHAGNFADLVKHAVLLAVIAQLKAGGALLDVLETHAGAGAYRLDDPAARRSGEARAGVQRLIAARDPPAPLARLAEAVRRFDGRDRLQRYPGSPVLASDAIGPDGRYAGCELLAGDHAALVETLKPYGGRAGAIAADGYREAPRRLALSGRRTLLLVDPPFERADDYARTADLIAARPCPARQPALIWTPLKDLKTFDAFLGRLERAAPARLSALEVRLRPLDDPMRLNGCALVLVDGPDVAEAALATGGWIATTLGEAGGESRWTDLSAPAT